MQALPPFKLAPYFQTRIWGFRDLAPWFDYRLDPESDAEPIGEVWLTGAKCAAVTGPLAGKSLSEIMTDHAPAVLGLDHAEAVLKDGLPPEFPLLIKVLFPREKLSVQVHPDDELARRIGEPRGKTECWYVLEAEPEAQVALGLEPGVTPELIRAAIENKNLEGLLKWLPIAAGDMVYVDAGTVHAIWPGAVILETQQTSDMTYRLYDYGRPRELHIEQSLLAMRLETAAGRIRPRIESDHTVVVDEKYFKVERWKLDSTGQAEKLTAACNHIDAQSAALLFVSHGAVKVEGEGFASFTIDKCELAVLPATARNWKLTVADSAEVMRILPR